MALLRWAPLVMMMAADVVIPREGGCCGAARPDSARYDRPPVGPPRLQVINNSHVDICEIEWLPEDGGPAQKMMQGGPDGPLKPSASRQFPLLADKVTLRLLDCEGKELLKRDVAALSGVVVIPYP